MRGRPCRYRSCGSRSQQVRIGCESNYCIVSRLIAGGIFSRDSEGIRCCCSQTGYSDLTFCSNILCSQFYNVISGNTLVVRSGYIDNSTVPSLALQRRGSHYRFLIVCNRCYNDMRYSVVHAIAYCNSKVVLCISCQTGYFLSQFLTARAIQYNVTRVCTCDSISKESAPVIGSLNLQANIRCIQHFRFCLAKYRSLSVRAGCVPVDVVTLCGVHTK